MPQNLSILGVFAQERRPATQTMEGKELRKIREAAGVSQADVAREIEISQSRLSYIEAGKRPITPEQFHRAVLFILARKEERDREFAVATGGSR